MQQVRTYRCGNIGGGKMKDFILSVIIGALSTYLPFWEWDGISTQIICGQAIVFIVWGILSFWREMEEKYGRK